MLPFVLVDRLTIDYQQSFFFGEDRHASQIKFSLKKIDPTPNAALKYFSKISANLKRDQPSSVLTL